MKNFLAFLLGVLLLSSCSQEDNSIIHGHSNPEETSSINISSRNKISSRNLSEEQIKSYLSSKEQYEHDVSDLENIIWFGRNAGIVGNYSEAIEVFTNGLILHPEEPRLYRHRGHRYISIRQFPDAIDDLLKATQLISGKQDQVEHFVSPNVKSRDFTTIHASTWYHLGLAYYFSNEFEESRKAFEQCKAIAKFDDNIVASSYWLYILHTRLGEHAIAKSHISDVNDKMDITDNYPYLKFSLFLQGRVNSESILGVKLGTAKNDIIRYGLGIWHLFHGNETEGKEILNELIKTGNRYSFAYIAAESDKLGNLF